ncbi:MAG: class I tRNA ligase family protein, partial [Proteobacteria bacterium]|nr:class I tRNA ligase family protein [Pseudomonadota bacterium]
LDTWFSSALWPFSTLGWPEQTAELKFFYPTSVLITSFDILFFWVARMMMMGLHFMDEVPFKDVYLHALVRDKDGKKMSKSTGNVIDPLVVMAEYGTDALRYTMTAFAAQGRDIRLSEERIEGYRHFINKIWNAARFSLMHIDACDPALTQNVQPATMALAHRWILSRLNKATREVHDSLAGFRFNDTASALYQFIWHEFCDWYLEWIKADLYGDNISKKTEAQTVLFTVLETVLKLLHPIAPFVTEEIWHFLPGHRPTLMTETYPLANPAWDDMEAEESAALIMGVIGGIRNIRSEMQIHPSAEIEAFAICPDVTKHQRLQTHASSIMGLTRTAKLDVQTSGTVPQGAASYIFEDMEIFVPLKGLIDVEKEVAKLTKNKEKIDKQANQTKAKLSNEKFLSNAPDDIIAKENAKLDEFTLQLSKIDETIARLLSI